MRLMAILAAAAALLLPGCVSTLDTAFEAAGGMDCSGDVKQVVSTEPTTLYPGVATTDPSPVANPSVTVHARAGQTIVGQATWARMGGDAKLAYDGPAANITVVTPGTWQVIATSGAEGAVTLGLEGDPFAFGSAYTLQLVATGCTPA